MRSNELAGRIVEKRIREDALEHRIADIASIAGLEGEALSGGVGLPGAQLMGVALGQIRVPLPKDRSGHEAPELTSGRLPVLALLFRDTVQKAGYSLSDYQKPL